MDLFLHSIIQISLFVLMIINAIVISNQMYLYISIIDFFCFGFHCANYFAEMCGLTVTGHDLCI